MLRPCSSECVFSVAATWKTSAAREKDLLSFVRVFSFHQHSHSYSLPLDREKTIPYLCRDKNKTRGLLSR